MTRRVPLPRAAGYGVRRVRPRIAGPILVLAAAAVLSGCGGDQSTLRPESRAADEITRLWWWMLAVACFVFAGALGMLVVAWFRRKRKGMPLVEGGKQLNLGLVVIFGIAIPVAVNVALFIVANFFVIEQTQAPAASTTPMTIEVVGKQWFWEVRYPGTAVVTANEIHIPARTRVNVVATTGDVIHSFWVPRLNRKIDMIPGRRNRVMLYADKPGRYRGQCAEFCGLEHAHMAMYVYAQEPKDFDRWLREQSQPATSGPSAGRDAFMRDGCAACHTIRGTPANGTVGPDLTHVGSRTTLAALTIPNDREALAQWLRDPDHIKPGTRMPDLRLSEQDVQSLVDYLEGLK